MVVDQQKKGKKLYKLVHSFITIHRYGRRSKGKQQQPKENFNFNGS